MKKFIISVLILCAVHAHASVSCVTTATGTTLCSGRDKSGNPEKSESYKTGTGTRYVKDSGDRNYECYKTATGTTYCE